MEFSAAYVWLGGVLVSIFTFFLGKSYTQTENVIAEKRRVYAEFIKVCPGPNEAHSEVDLISVELQRFLGILTIYGSPDVIKFAGEYFNQFSIAQPELQGIEHAGHTAFLKLMTCYNRMIWEMRKDALMWSFFAPTGESKVYKPSIGPDKVD